MSADLAALARYYRRQADTVPTLFDEATADRIHEQWLALATELDEHLDRQDHDPDQPALPLT